MKKRNPPSLKASARRRKKIVITGAGGYVGSTLANMLKDEYEIIGFGHSKNLNLATFDVARFVEGDVRDYKALSRAVKGAYAVIHTASPTRESFCKEYPYEALQAIVYGTRNVRRAVEEHNVPILIHFSTQAVYSNFKKRAMPLRENMKLEPDTLYGALKASAEDELSESRAIIIRPANIYGIGNGELRNNVIHSFVEKAKNGEPLIMYGGGKQRMDFIHVRDIARIVECLITNPPPKNFLPLVINVSSGKSVSIQEISACIAKISKELFGKPSLITKKSSGNIAVDRWLSNNKARKILGWSPKITLEEGIRELLQ